MKLLRPLGAVGDLGSLAAVANGDTCRNQKPEDIHFSLPLNFKYFTRVSHKHKLVRYHFQGSLENVV